jgi:hypothetical protein
VSILLDEKSAVVPVRLAGEQSGAGVSTPVWCGAWFGPDPSGQYSQVAGTQRKTSPSTATWQTDGNDR